MCLGRKDGWCVGGLLDVEADCDAITSALVQFDEGSCFPDVVIQRESGSDAEMRSSGDGWHEAPGAAMGVWLPWKREQGLLISP